MSDEPLKESTEDGMPVGRTEAGGPKPVRTPGGRPAGPEETLVEILEELRGMRRERQIEDFSFGKMAGAVAQAFALCAIGWALYAAINNDLNGAILRFLAAIAFQLVALTWYTSGRRG